MIRTDHIALIVNDAQKVSNFYKTAFGYETVEYRDFGNGITSEYLSIPNETFRLQLLTLPNAEKYEGKYGHMAFKVDDIDEIYKKHKDLGYTVGDLQDLGYQKCYFVQDFEGNEIEIIEVLST